MEIGRITTLHIVRIRDFGAFLAAPEDTDGKDTVLLPRKQMPEGAAEGDAVARLRGSRSLRWERQADSRCGR